MDEALVTLYETAIDRKEHPSENSYTRYLFDNGLDKILKKVGEECAETIIAAKNGVKSELVYEMSDLLYHLTVLMVQTGITPEDIAAELRKRSEKTGHLKKQHQTDKNT